MSYKEELLIDVAKIITMSETTGKELAKKFGLKLLPFEAYAPGRYLLAVLDELEKMDRANKLGAKFSRQLRIALRKTSTNSGDSDYPKIAYNGYHDNYYLP